MPAAGVPGRGEYWKVNAPAKRAARTTSRVACEVRLGLAGEAHDDVGGDGRVGDARAHLVDDREVALLAVAAPHRLEHRVGAGLQRHVQAGHHVRRLGHRLDDVVGEVPRVRAGEAHPLEPVDVAAGPQQLGEGAAVAELDAVGVHVLAEQRDLEDAVGDERLDLGEHVARAPVLLDARAGSGTMQNVQVLLQPTRDRDPAGVRAVAAGRQRRGEGLQRLEDLDLRLLVVPGALEQRRQRPDVVRAEHDVDPGRACARSRRGPSAPGSHRRRSACPGRAAFTGARWPRLP